MITKEQIAELVGQKINDSHLFLVDVKVGTGNKIEVYVDGDNGISITDCKELSRHIEKNLDREAEDFSLEVSSPGATLPLKLVRQYTKHVGREFEIEMKDGEKINGKLVNIEGNNITIETTTREKKTIGKGKVTVTKQQVLNLDNIKESKIKLKF